MVTTEKGPGYLKMTLPAALDNIEEAVAEARRFLSENGVEDHYFDTILILREGLTNAVRHGSASDAGKTVSCAFRLKEGAIILEIEDEGDGFDWRAHPMTAPDISSDSGRGMAIMKSFSSDMEYNEKGNVLTLIRYIR